MIYMLFLNKQENVIKKVQIQRRKYIQNRVIYKTANYSVREITLRHTTFNLKLQISHNMQQNYKYRHLEMKTKHRYNIREISKCSTFIGLKYNVSQINIQFTDQPTVQFIWFHLQNNKLNWTDLLIKKCYKFCLEETRYIHFSLVCYIAHR